MVESVRGLNRRAVIVGEGCTDLQFEIRSLVGDDVLGHFDPLALLLHTRIQVSPEGSQIDFQLGIPKMRASARVPTPLLQNQAWHHARAIRHRRHHLLRHPGHHSSQAMRPQLRPQSAPRLVRQDHSRAYVLVSNMQQEVRALVELTHGPTKPKHTPAICPQLSRWIRIDTETAIQVGAAAQQDHRAIHLLLVVGSRAEPWELFRFHVDAEPRVPKTARKSPVRSPSAAAGGSLTSITTASPHQLPHPPEPDLHLPARVGTSR